jgi:hypothetical protein
MGLTEQYKEIDSLDNPLTGISGHIDFVVIGLILSDLYENDNEKGGRPIHAPRV